MTPMDLQHALVSLVALVAVAVLVRRLFGFARPSSTPACANCPSAAGRCQVPAPVQRPVAHPAHPLVFVRPSRP